MKELLPESKEHYRTFLENSIDAVIVAFPDGRIEAVNTEACRLFQMTEKEIIQAGREGIIDTSDPKIQAGLSARDRTGRFKGEINLKRKDGTIFPAEISSGFFTDQHRVKKAIIIIRDITERKRMEEVLRESEEQLRLAKSAGKMGIHDYRPTSGSLYWDEYVRELWGLGPDDHVDYEVFINGVHPEDRETTDKAVLCALDPAGNGSLDIEYRLVRRGQTRWIAATGQASFGDGVAVRFVGTVQDITERKRTEKELRESEEKYRTLVEQADDGIIIVQDAILKFVNRRMAELLGHTVKFLTGSSIRGFIDEREVAKITEMHWKRMTGEHLPSRYEALLKRRDGSPIQTELNVMVISYGGRPATQVTVTDIAERKKMEEAIRKSRDELELHVQERTLALRDSYDKLRLEVDERKRSEALLVEGRDLALELSATSDLHQALDLCLDAALTLGRMDLGGVYLVNENTRALHLEVHRNLSNGFFSKVTDYPPESPNAILVSRGQPVYTNGKELALLPELDCEDMVRGLAILPIVSGSRVIACLNVASRTSDVISESSRVVLETVAAQVAGALDRIAKERKRAELEEQLRQSHKMEAIGTLAGGIAHDFNNMLAVIMGNAELALDDVDKPEPRQNLEAILGASKRSRDLVRQILTFSRKSGIEEKAVDMESLLKETEGLLRSSLPTTIRIGLHVHTRPGTTVMADPSKIQQVVLNLANNAAHAMRKKGGTLTIALSTVDLGTDSSLSETPAGPYVKLTVKDTGTGIPPEIRRRIFEPFFTTKEPGQGTGMGLAVVYGIVKDSNGMIEVESEVDKGTTFAVLFPQSDITFKGKLGHQGADVRGKEHILLVDDEVSFVEITKLMLERLGYRVTSATNSIIAMRLFITSPNAFDLIITDQTMPDFTGIELAREVQSIRKNMPVILCTGYSETVSPEIAQEAGVCQFLMKPIRKRQMAQAIRRALDKRETRVQ